MSLGTVGYDPGVHPAERTAMQDEVTEKIKLVADDQPGDHRELLVSMVADDSKWRARDDDEAVSELDSGFNRDSAEKVAGDPFADEKNWILACHPEGALRELEQERKEKERRRLPSFLKVPVWFTIDAVALTSQTLVLAGALVMAGSMYSGNSDAKFMEFLTQSGIALAVVVQWFASAGLWTGWRNMNGFALWGGRLAAYFVLNFLWTKSFFITIDDHVATPILVGCVVCFLVCEWFGKLVRQSLLLLRSGDKIAAAFGLCSLPLGALSAYLIYQACMHGSAGGSAEPLPDAYWVPDLSLLAGGTFVCTFLPSFLAVRATTTTSLQAANALVTAFQLPLLFGLLCMPVLSVCMCATVGMLGPQAQGLFQAIPSSIVSSTAFSAGWTRFSPMVICAVFVVLAAVVGGTAATYLNRRDKVELYKKV